MLLQEVRPDDDGSDRLWGRPILQRWFVETLEVYIAVPAAVGVFTVERRLAW